MAYHRSVLMPHPFEWSVARFPAFDEIVSNELECLLFYDRVYRPPSLILSSSTSDVAVGIGYSTAIETMRFELNTQEILDACVKHARPRTGFYGLTEELIDERRLYPLGLVVEIHAGLTRHHLVNGRAHVTCRLQISEGWEYDSSRIPYAGRNIRQSEAQNNERHAQETTAWLAFFERAMVETLIAQTPVEGGSPGPCRIHDHAIRATGRPAHGEDMEFDIELVVDPAHLDAPVAFRDDRGHALLTMTRLEMALARAAAHVFFRLRGGDCAADRTLPTGLSGPVDAMARREFLLDGHLDTDIARVREVMLSGIGNFSEGIRGGGISVHDCERLLVRSEDWRDWLNEADTDDRLLTQVFDAISRDHLLARLPAKTVRWGICTAAGLGVDLLGAGGLGTATAVGISAIDAFVLDAAHPERKLRAFCHDVRAITAKARATGE